VTDERALKLEYAGDIRNNNLSENDFFIRKAEISVTERNITSRFNASIRFRRPDSMLVSIRSMVGIEAGRMLLTRDTLLINDRVNKKLIRGSTESLEAKYGIDPSLILALLGDFIISKEDDKRKMNCINGIYRDNFEVNGKSIEYTVDCRRGKITGAYFEGTLTTGNISLTYGRFKKIGGILIPGEITMKDDLSELGINIKIDNAETGWKGSIGFIPGSGYDIVNLR
jgi:hypothetical protein